MGSITGGFMLGSFLAGRLAGRLPENARSGLLTVMLVSALLALGAALVAGRLETSTARRI